MPTKKGAIEFEGACLAGSVTSRHSQACGLQIPLKRRVQAKVTMIAEPNGCGSASRATCKTGRKQEIQIVFCELKPAFQDAGVAETTTTISGNNRA